MLACVVNLSEGRDEAALAALAAAGGVDLLDLHADPHHHRCVLTLVGEEAPRRVAAEAVARLDLRHHDGVHPRIGVVDVVPFVALEGSTGADALRARDDFVRWAVAALALPCYRYGPERTLPEVRRLAAAGALPDEGPAPNARTGACAVGARPVLVAYNVWLAEPDLALARRVASEVRSPRLRALGLQVGDRVQVSMNLVAPTEVGPAAAFDLVAARAPVAGAELVGLLPDAVLRSVPSDRWGALDLSADRTLEARLRRRAGQPAAPA